MQGTEHRFAGVLWRSFAVRAGLVVALSILVNAVIVVVGDALRVAPGFRPLTLPPVVVLSAVGAVGAVVVYGLLRRYVDTPDRAFRRVAAAVLVLSFVPDLALLSADPTATVPGVGALMLMHVVVAVAAVALLPIDGWRGGTTAGTGTADRR